MNFYERTVYHIYPLGFCGAPRENDGIVTDRIKKTAEWAPYIASLGAGGVYLGPVFESGTHGYDTTDYRKIDARLGTNEDFAHVCRTLHENGLGIILDGVFNHVGRDFFAFRDVREKKWDSPYKDWFHISFDGNSAYDDGFWYEGWEGHFELVKLNLGNPDVRNYLINSVRGWIADYDIDGLRLDVAYMLDGGFMRELAETCRSIKNDFFLVGEMIHGDYNRLLGTLDSVTNYECYKGLYSAFNSMNMFEIGHSLTRQFGSEPWCLYRGRHLASFADNHDVTRIASILTRKEHLVPLYGLLFGMPGIPFVYYGSEWGAEGRKENGDDALRPSFDAPVKNTLSESVSRFIKARRDTPELSYGGFKIIHMANRQLVFERNYNGESTVIAVNADEEGYSIPPHVLCGGHDILSGEEGGDVNFLPPFSVRYVKR